MIGKTLINFEITTLIGRGGMERYTTRRIGRDVAIKVLPEEFAKNTDCVSGCCGCCPTLSASGWGSMAQAFYYTAYRFRHPTGASYPC